jgi:type II secretory pathway pseudopilin PulG
VQLLVSNSASETTHVALFSAFLIALLYGALFLRTLKLKKFKWYRRVFNVAMIAVAVIFTVLAIVGPVATLHLIRNDSLVDNNLSIVQANIDTYVGNNNKLPTRLNSIGLTGDAQKLATKNLVQYVPNTKHSTYSSDAQSTTYYYELCVNYKKSSNSDGGSPYSAGAASANNYNDIIDTSNHPSGHYCYEISSSNNTATGLIVGTPTQAGTESTTVSNVSRAPLTK